MGKMDVSNVSVADRPGFLARSMTINPTGANVTEHIYANERQGEIIYRIVDPKTKRETDDERVIAVKEGPLRMEFFHRHVSDGYRSYWEKWKKLSAKERSPYEAKAAEARAAYKKAMEKYKAENPDSAEGDEDNEEDGEIGD